ncbi:MAG: hypothetical protein R6X17_01680 [Candidatus Competibacteraceae bacterium]
MSYGLFLAKAATLVVAALALLGGIVVLARHGERPESRGRLEVRHLNHDYENMALTLKVATLPKKVFKQARKEQKAKDNQRKKTLHRWVLRTVAVFGENTESAFFTLPESGQKGGCGSGIFGEFLFYPFVFDIFLSGYFSSWPSPARSSATLGRRFPADASLRMRRKRVGKFYRSKLVGFFGIEQCFCL